MDYSNPRASSCEPLSIEYHKSRKQLMLWSGIGLVWTLVGFDLDKLSRAEGNIGAIVSSIKNTHAIPRVMLTLVVYFIIKTSIEWSQCNEERRARFASKVDFFISIFVSAAAGVFLSYSS